MDKQTYTKAELASILGVCTRTIERRINDGAISQVQLVPGGAVRITHEEVQRILGQRNGAPGSVASGQGSVGSGGNQSDNPSAIPSSENGVGGALTPSAPPEAATSGQCSVVRGDQESVIPRGSAGSPPADSRRLSTPVAVAPAAADLPHGAGGKSTTPPSAPQGEVDSEQWAVGSGDGSGNSGEDGGQDAHPTEDGEHCDPPHHEVPA